MVPPRFGLLKAAIEPYFEGRIPDLQLVPISLDYEKTLEGKLYADELLGIPKPKENLVNLLSPGTAKTIMEGHGKVSARFGVPVSLKATIVMMVKEREESGGAVFSPATVKSDMKLLIHRCAFIVVGEQLENCSCMPTHLVSALLLHRRRSSVSLERLVAQVAWLQSEVVRYGGHVACIEGLERTAVVERALRLLGDAVDKRDDGMGITVIDANIHSRDCGKNAMILALNRNKLIHTFAADAVVAIAFITCFRAAFGEDAHARVHREELQAWSSSKPLMEHRFDLTVAGVTSRFDANPTDGVAAEGYGEEGNLETAAIGDDGALLGLDLTRPGAVVSKGAVLDAALSLWTLLQRELVHLPASFAKGGAGAEEEKAFPWIDQSEMPLLVAAMTRVCGPGGCLSDLRGSSRSSSGGTVGLAEGGLEQLLFLASLVWPLVDSYWVAMIACKDWIPLAVDSESSAAAFVVKGTTPRGRKVVVRRRKEAPAAAPKDEAPKPLKVRLLRRAEKLFNANALDHFESCSAESMDQAISRLTECRILAKAGKERVVTPLYQSEDRLDELAAEIFRFRKLPPPPPLSSDSGSSGAATPDLAARL